MNYIVTLEGKKYEVEVECADISQAAPEQANTAPVNTNAGGETITAPMPGTIVGIKVEQGQQVKKGDVLLILEAMKMENEMMAPIDGRISQIAVSEGAAVNVGDKLIVIG